MAINLDFGDVGGLPPEGTYDVNLKEVTIKDGPAGKYLNMLFEITGPTNASAPLWHISSLSQQSRWKLQSDLEAITGIDWKEDGMQLELADLPGSKCRAVVYHEEYNGQLRAKIQTLLPPSK